ncbi:UNVERIFIED_CONTAM: hypothetical protein Slati_3036800 [Sesamum latifolium]|uniref:Uncharacterized protein n=1 Tax=Sesamum latifolium TaxID=2727402 RepID=A0AAW2VH24_9LAMI
MKPEYMFLTMVIPGPSNPKRHIDVYLEPLIEELLQLWHVGVLTHDHAMNQTFMMRAALMWTVNDLPVYGMASGWSTAVLWGALFVWRTHRHSICSIEGRHAISIVTDSSISRPSVQEE